MTDKEIISQTSEKQFNEVCEKADATKDSLSDASVIKALECCASENGNDCEDCLYSSAVYRQGEGGKMRNGEWKVESGKLRKKIAGRFSIFNFQLSILHL